MNPDQHMQRAFKRLEVARFTLASGYPDGSRNRSYFVEVVRPKFLPDFNPDPTSEIR